jgi:hypothetical protein
MTFSKSLLVFKDLLTVVHMFFDNSMSAKVAAMQLQTTNYDALQEQEILFQNNCKQCVWVRSNSSVQQILKLRSRLAVLTVNENFASS